VYTLDTNAIIYYLGKDEVVRPYVDGALQRGLPLYASAITVGELFRYPNLTVDEATNIGAFLSICSIINLDSALAQQAGAIGAKHNLKLADSIIAATALFTGTALLTRNVRDFKRVAGLRVEAI